MSGNCILHRRYRAVVCRRLACNDKQIVDYTQLNPTIKALKHELSSNTNTFERKSQQLVFLINICKTRSLFMKLFHARFRRTDTFCYLNYTTSRNHCTGTFELLHTNKITRENESTFHHKRLNILPNTLISIMQIFPFEI